MTLFWFLDGGMCKLTDTQANLGKYTATFQENQQCPSISKTITAGQYKISIWEANSDKDIATVNDASDNYFNITNNPVACAGEGQTDNIISNSFTGCCSGLTKITNSFSSGNTCTASTISSYICTYCGDGVCGKGENACNCPSDCKKTENLPPVVDGITAPTQLNVNEQGTWQIKAHDPENGYLTYSVDWGDSLYFASGASVPTILKEGVQTSTFNHAYSKAGTYTITFTISDNNYKSVKTSATVNVVETQIKSITVVSPNGGERWEVGDAKPFDITWKSTGLSLVSLYLKFTDGATCYLKDANASNGKTQVWIGANSVCQNINRTVVDGQYKIFIVNSADDRNKEIGVSDESDNYFSIIQTNNKPDLIVKDFTYQKLSTTTNSALYFTITIQNISEVNATLPVDMQTNIYKNKLSFDQKIGGVSIGTLSASNKILAPNETFTFNVATTQGVDLSNMTSIIVQTDDSDIVLESNDSNDSLTKSFAN